MFFAITQRLHCRLQRSLPSESRPRQVFFFSFLHAFTARIKLIKIEFNFKLIFAGLSKCEKVGYFNRVSVTGYQKGFFLLELLSPFIKHIDQEHYGIFFIFLFSFKSVCIFMYIIRLFTVVYQCLFVLHCQKTIRT